MILKHLIFQCMGYSCIFDGDDEKHKCMITRASSSILEVGLYQGYFSHRGFDNLPGTIIKVSSSYHGTKLQVKKLFCLCPKHLFEVFDR